jgi:hypothetical protein
LRRAQLHHHAARQQKKERSRARPVTSTTSLSSNATWHAISARVSI